ncbi:uncharacterized protein [Eucyclogobius newberryi]|uniref:uncharacterized protein n=1 Tax=Eucyclogobius newberryi TaxID=166745 RepID=UPI003B592AAB
MNRLKRMSTSDVSEPRRWAGGGETETRRSSALTPTQTTREQEATPVNGLEHLPVSESEPCHPQTFTALTKKAEDDADRTEKPTFTSHFSLNLGSKPGLRKTEPNVYNRDTPTDCFHGPSRVCDEAISYRVHDLTLHAAYKIPFHLRKVTEAQNCTSIETSSSAIQSFSNGCGLRKENTPQSGIPAKRPNSLDLNVDKTRAKELSGHSAMLSSTVVTVMAPQWSGRLRRSKREGTGTSDLQGNSQSRMDYSSGVEKMLSSGLQSRHHAPFVRSSTVGWSTRSGPTTLDNDRMVHQSASLDMRLDDKQTDRPIPSPLSPLSPLSPVSPMSINSNEPQRSPQRGHSPLSSKPTTSSMLLSLRRVNSPMSPTENQTQSPENENGNRQFSTHLSQSFQYKNQLSPTSISNNGNAPLSPSPTHRDRLSTSYNYSTVPSQHTAESAHSQAGASQDVLPPPRSFSREPPDSIKITKMPLTLPKRTPYDHTALLKSHTTPRRPLLSSVTWMHQDNQAGSSQITSNVNNKTNAHVTAPFNSKSIQSDNKGINGQIPNYRGNKNMAELGGNLMLQGGSSGTQNSPNHHPSSQFKAQVDSCLNRDPPKPMSLPGALSNSKFSLAATHTATSQANPTNYDASSGLFTAKRTEFTPTMLSPKSSYTPTDNNSKYQNMYGTSKTTSPMPQNTDKFSKQSHLNDITNAVTNANYKSSLDMFQNNNATSFQSTLNSSNVSAATSSAKEETLSPKCNTPLGFERSYVPKPYQAKTNLSPTISLYSKTNYSPTHTVSTPASSPSYLSPHSPPVTVSSLLTPPPTPNYNSPSSPQTPSLIANRVYSNSVDSYTEKKTSKGEKKLSKRVTFKDTVDSNTEEKQETLNPLTPRNVKAPSIFDVLRSGNQPHTFAPTSKSSSIQVGAGTKYRSLSSDSVELKPREMYKQQSTETFDYKNHGLNMPRQERTLSAESATQYRSSAPLSLPPDFSNGYKNRYSSPPYSTLVSSRTSQPETKTKPPRSPVFQRHSQSNSPGTTPTSTSSVVKNALLASGSLSLRPVPIDIQDSLKVNDLSLDQVNNNPIKSVGELLANGQIQLVDNRVQISSQSLPGDKTLRISSCVTETLVYSIKGRQDGPRTALPKCTANMPIAKETQLSQQVQIKEVLKEQDSMSNLSSSSSIESQNIDDDGAKRKIKEVGKSKFYSIEYGSEQSPKRSRFALKKSSSTPSASLTRSDSEKTSKVDQMISKIKQTFSSRKPNNDEESFPKKWRKASLVPSSSGVSDRNTIESNKTLEEEAMTSELNNNHKGIEDRHRWANNRYTLVQAPIEKNKIPEEFPPWTDELMTDTEGLPENRGSPYLKIHSPSQDDEAFDFKQNPFLSPKDTNSGYSPNSPIGFRKSSSSPRPSLSPLSSFSSTDMLDDSVFYSPKPPRQKDSSSSPCELGEISLVASRRSRASTGPPSTGPVTNKERMSSSYADLKYGIEPGRSFSVSSVLSSRPSGPGRISTGSRFMSVGDLTKPSTFSCGHTAGDSDNWSGQSSCETNSQTGRCPNDGKIRSRSLPRSFTQSLSSWRQSNSSSNPTWGQSTDTVDFPLDIEGPPTPPSTPPLSPIMRRISKPLCLSPPSSAGHSEPPQDNLSPRGHLPSRGYMSSLSTFEESSDSSSDTTTEDEYYFEAGEDEEKETEL